MAAHRWNERDVVQAVVTNMYPEPWLHLPKFRPGTSTGQWAEKEFDCFVFHPWRSEGYARHVIEAKISRSDFLKEAKDPIKKRAGLYCSTGFYFAAPPGIVRNLEEIPSNCGYYLVNIDEAGQFTCERIIAAPELADEPPTWNFAAAITRRVLGKEAVAEIHGEIAKLQDQLKKSKSMRRLAAQEIQRLNLEVERLTKMNDKLRKAVKL